VGEKANEKGKSRKGTNQDQGRSPLLDEKNTAIKKAEEGPTTLFTRHKDSGRKKNGRRKGGRGRGKSATQLFGMFHGVLFASIQ